MARSKSSTGRGVQGKSGRRYELTDEAWQRIEPLLPKQSRGGRWNDHRITLNGIFWILNSGAVRDLPERYGKWQSVYDRYRRWTREGLFDRILHRLHLELDDDGRIDYGASPRTVTLTWAPTADDKAGVPYYPEVYFLDPLGESSADTSDCWFTIEDVNLPPAAACGGDITVEADGPYGTYVTLLGTGTDDDDTDLMYHWDISNPAVVLDDSDSATPTGLFPIGITQAILTVTGGQGGMAECWLYVTVQDTTPSEVICIADVAALWPPKHDMREVTIKIAATDACVDPDFVFPLLSATVTSDEPDDAIGNGDGAAATCCVIVPHDRRGGN